MFPAPHQRRRELCRIGGANAVCIRQILGERPDLLGWQYLIPSDAKLRKQPHRCGPFVNGELSLPDESGESAPRFDWCAPPHDHALQLAVQPATLRSPRL